MYSRARALRHRVRHRTQHTPQPHHIYLIPNPMNTINAIAKHSHYTCVIGQRTSTTPLEEERNTIRMSARTPASGGVTAQEPAFHLKAWVHKSVYQTKKPRRGRRKDNSGLVPMAMCNACFFVARQWTTCQDSKRSCARIRQV